MNKQINWSSQSRISSFWQGFDQGAKQDVLQLLCVNDVQQQLLILELKEVEQTQ